MSKEGQAPPSPPPSFCFLDKIYSIKKQLQIFDILQAIRPTHAERLWLVGFLKYTGYSFNGVLDIIDKHCEWSDYDADHTAYEVATVFKQLHRTGNNNTDSKCRVRKWDLTRTEVYRIKLARSAESHRELEKWMQENDVPVYDAAPDLEFNPTKMEQEK